MQLTQFTDYSLRVLIYLARLPEPGMATVPEIAEHYGVSRNHLVKVVNNLASQGFIMTTRGKGGGMQLARPARTIGVGEVVRLTEPSMNLVECFDPKANQCRIVRGCFLKAILHEARRSFLATLDQYTLADAARIGFEAESLLSPTPDAASASVEETLAQAEFPVARGCTAKIGR